MKLIDTIYVEEEVIKHPRTETILKRFRNARHVTIGRYGEVFNKRSQNFRLQKTQPALILARKHSGRVLKTPEGFGIGAKNNFYFAHMLNCLYDCRYCFLQGMYSSSNYVLFVNFEEFDADIHATIHRLKEEAVTFFSGYDCDSLAFESISGFATHIIPIFRHYPSAILEFRTKSTAIRSLEKITPASNCVIAFSLIPHAMSKVLEPKVSSIQKRIDTLKKLADLGWKIGLRFDPLICGKDWRGHYKHLFETVFMSIPNNSIHSVSYGPLRFPKAVFRNVSRLYPEEKLFAGLLSQKDGMFSYRSELEEEMSSFCQKSFAKFVPKSIVFRCASDKNQGE